VNERNPAATRLIFLSVVDPAPSRSGRAPREKPAGTRGPAITRRHYPTLRTPRDLRFCSWAHRYEASGSPLQGRCRGFESLRAHRCFLWSAGIGVAPSTHSGAPWSVVDLAGIAGFVRTRRRRRRRYGRVGDDRGEHGAVVLLGARGRSPDLRDRFVQCAQPSCASAKCRTAWATDVGSKAKARCRCPASPWS
jgi:hypothetical protein